MSVVRTSSAGVNHNSPVLVYAAYGCGSHIRFTAWATPRTREIHPAGRCKRGPLGLRLNEPMPSPCDRVTARLFFLMPLAGPIRVHPGPFVVKTARRTIPVRNATDVRNDRRSIDGYLTLFSIGF